MIKPIGKKLVVETISDNQSSLILLNPEKPQKGKVLARGLEVDESIQIGNIVSFARYAGTEVHEGSGKLLIIEEKDILAYELR